MGQTWLVMVPEIFHHQLLGTKSSDFSSGFGARPHIRFGLCMWLKGDLQISKSWLMWSRVRSAKKNWGNGPTRCTSSLRSCRWRATCSTWTACCLISLTPCSPWHKSRVPGPATGVTVSSRHSPVAFALASKAMRNVFQRQVNLRPLSWRVDLFNFLYYLRRTFITPYLHAQK